MTNMSQIGLVNKQHLGRYLGNTEIKVFDNILNNGISTTQSNFWPVIPQGTGLAERVGRTVKVVGVSYVLIFVPSDSTQMFRATSGILPGGGAPGTVLASLYTAGVYYYPLNTDVRAIIDHDDFHGTSASSANLVDGATRPTTILERHTPHAFNILHDAAGNMLSNIPFLSLVCDSAAAPNPTVRGFYRVWFTDA